MHFKRQREEREDSDTGGDLIKGIASLRLDAMAGKGEALERLLELNENRIERVRLNATDASVAASSVGQSGTFKTLGGVLANHRNEFIRRKAVDSLPRLSCDKHGEAIKTLCPFASHEDEYVRRVAAETMCSVAVAGREVTAAPLEQLTAHSEEYIRRLASHPLIDV